MKHILLVALMCLVAGERVSMQTPNPADGPWAGWAQCVLTAQFAGQGQTYLHQQTHTWVLTSSTPGPTSSSAIKQYAATWQVTGQGTRQRGQGNSEQWTTAGQPMPDTLTIRLTAEGTVRIGGAAEQRSTGTTTGVAMPYVDEWPFPVIEGAATQTSITGSGPSGLSANFPGAPPGTSSTVTCAWNFVRGGATPQPPSPRSVGPLSGQTEFKQNLPVAIGAGTTQTVTLAPGQVAAGPNTTQTVTFPPGQETAGPNTEAVTAAPSQRTTTSPNEGTATIIVPVQETGTTLAKGPGPAPTGVRISGVLGTNGVMISGSKIQNRVCRFYIGVAWEPVASATGYTIYVSDGTKYGVDAKATSYELIIPWLPVPTPQNSGNGDSASKEISIRVGASYSDRSEGFSPWMRHGLLCSG